MHQKSWFRSVFLFRLIYIQRRNRTLCLCNLNTETQMTTGNSSLSRFVALYCTKTKMVNNERDFRSLGGVLELLPTPLPLTQRRWSFLTCSSPTSDSRSGIALPLTQDCLKSFIFNLCIGKGFRANYKPCHPEVREFPSHLTVDIYKDVPDRDGDFCFHGNNS